MKIGFSTLTLMGHRQDKPQQLASARVVQQSNERAAAASEDDPFTKRLKNQREALESLASLPSPKEASQQRATEKAGFLRQRLEMLKAMMAFASPEQLKNMAKELKSIARELAGAARLLSNAGGGSANLPATPSVSVTAASGADTTASPQSSDAITDAKASAPADEQVARTASEASQAEDSVEKSAQESAEEAKEDAKQTSGLSESQPERKSENDADDDEADPLGLLASVASPLHAENSRTNGPSASENGLRNALADAKKTLEETVSALKIKLTEADKEARRELIKAEKDIDKLDRALAVSTSDALYSSLGQLLPPSSSGVMGLQGTIQSTNLSTINVEV
tara:strand:- start:382 stop:1401 length:1020 start_codon:yes stop_codon:yes gene_type:complete